MGQQQLILLVLATVIVGLAIVVGIRAFSENSAKANADAMMQDAVRIASDAQATVKKAGPFGGVNGFDEIDFSKMGYPNPTAGVYKNLNGAYFLTATANGVVIDAGSDTTATTADGEQLITVAVCGMSDTDIAGEIITVGGQSTGAAAPSC